MASITKSYEPQEVEKKWYADWLQAGCFAGKANSARPPYTIMIPPPNVTGVLTMGHVLNNTLQDILVPPRRPRGTLAAGHRPCGYRHPDRGGARAAQGEENPP
jgi:valyl-tRNA synthetase